MAKTATPSLHDLIANIALKAFHASQPAGIHTGVVVTTNPLSINVDNKFLVPYQFITLTNSVRDYEVDIEVSMQTDENDLKQEDDGCHTHEHYHPIRGIKKIKVYNGLKEGEKVIIVRAQGGQEFIVLDRISKYEAKGQWND